MSKTMYKDYSADENAKISEMRLACLDKEGPQATVISMSVKLSPCSVSLMNPEWIMMNHPIMRPTYLIVPTLILKGAGWTLKITRIVSVRVVLGKKIRPRNEKMRRPTMNMSEQPCMLAWLQWLTYVLCSFENWYLRLQSVSLHL